MSGFRHRPCSLVIILRYVIIVFIFPTWAKKRRNRRLASICGVITVVDAVHTRVWSRLVSISEASLSRRYRPERSLRNTSILPILLVGCDGNGKTILARRLAHHFGLKYFEVDCFSLWSEVAGTCEAKLRNTFAQAANVTPCVFVLKHVDVVGKDATTDDYDPRVITCLKEQLRSPHAIVSGRKMIVIGTATKAGSLCVSLASEFLYQFEVEPLDEQERMLFLNELLRSHKETAGIANDASRVQTLAKRAAGYTVAGIERVIETARYLARKRNDNSEQNDVLCWQTFEDALLSEQSKMSDAIGAPKVPDVRWQDVGGLTNVKETLLESIRMYVDRPELAAIGLRRSGILLYGPPGCGKTLIAKAVATECALNFLSVKGPELLNMYVGQSEQNIREVFDRARVSSPCVVFFDELDALAPNRGRSGDSGGVMDRVVSQLLAEMDGLQHRGDIFIIGATNRVDLIDPSLLRPGRFDKTVYVGLGNDLASRLAVFDAVTRRLSLHSSVNSEEIVQSCPGDMSGADFYALAAEAALSAAQRKVEELRKSRWEKRRPVNEEMISADDDDNSSESEDDAHTDYRVVITPADFQDALRHLKPSVSVREAVKYAAGQNGSNNLL